MNLVFSGGGINSLCYIGVLQCLEERGLLSKVRRIIGSSGGALFCLPVVLGYSCKDVTQILFGLNIETLQDITSDTILQFFDSFGFDTGKRLEQLVKLLLEKKVHNGLITFEELYAVKPIDFTVTGFCLSRKDTEYFNRHTTPNMPVYLAIRISCSIPFIYNYVPYQGRIYLDGGVLDNYPIDYFHDEADSTIGFCLSREDNSNNSSTSDNRTDRKNILEFVYSLLVSLNHKLQKQNLRKYCNQTVVICSDLHLTQFSLSDAQKKECIDKGYAATNAYFRQQATTIVSSLVKDIVSKAIAMVGDESDTSDEEDVIYYFCA